MSTLMNQARSRVPRIAEAAVERARLSVVPRAAVKKAGRLPFAVLIALLLVGGVAGLLMFNTSMQQASFTLTKLQSKAQDLNAQREGLKAQMDALDDPQNVAIRAKKMGMVPSATPAFIRLRDGKVLGTPRPGTWADTIRINPPPTRKPKDLVRKPRVVHKPAIEKKTDKHSRKQADRKSDEKADKNADKKTDTRTEKKSDQKSATPAHKKSGHRVTQSGAAVQ